MCGACCETHSSGPIYEMECLSPSFLLPAASSPISFCWLWAPGLKDPLSFPSGAAGAAAVGGPLTFSHPLNKAVLGDGKMTRCLRALTALPKDPGSVPSTHLMTNNTCSRTSDILWLPCRQDAHTHKIKIVKICVYAHTHTFIRPPEKAAFVGQLNR